MRLEGRQRPHRLASALRRSIVQRKIRAVDGCGGGGDAQREAVRQRRHRTAQSLEEVLLVLFGSQASYAPDVYPKPVPLQHWFRRQPSPNRVRAHVAINVGEQALASAH